MLYYLKYSHLDNIPEDDYLPVVKEYKNIGTQFPNIKNKSTETYNKEMEDKATDTLDDLHKIDYKYKLEGKSKQLKSEEKLRGDFIGQVETVPITRKNRQRSNSESSNSSGSSGIVSKGLRYSEMAGNVMLQSFNLASGTMNATMNLIDLIEEAILYNNSHHSEEEEETPEVATEEVPSASNQIPVRRERSRSRDGEDNDYNPASSSHQNPFRRGRSRSRDDSEYEPDDDLGERLLRRGASRSRSSTPKGYPKKKDNNPKRKK